MSAQRASLRRQLFFWLIVALAALFFVWILRGILLPFVMGLAIAYFLDPVVDKLEKIGFSRFWATVFITGCFGIVLVLISFVLIPILYSEAHHIVRSLPDNIKMLKENIPQWKSQWFGDIQLIDPERLDAIIKDLTKEATSLVPKTALSLASGSLALINILSLVLITPVVTFYMLMDWNKILGFVDSNLPRDYAETIRRLAGEMDIVMAGFVRGQVTILLMLGTYFIIGLSLVGLKFGVLIGLIAGLISFIPFVGSLTGFLLATGVALAQFLPDWTPVLLVIAVFFSGQLIEGYVLTPKIVGDNVKLHPVWLIFSLFVFGYLLGFVGLLIAVPVAAAIGVLVRFAFEKYHESEFYKGQGGAS